MLHVLLVTAAMQDRGVMELTLHLNSELRADYRFRRLARHPTVVPGCPHHLMVRRDDLAPMLKADGGRSPYCALLGQLRQELGLKVYAYCGMPTHDHVILAGLNTNTIQRVVSVLCGPGSGDEPYSRGRSRPLKLKRRWKLKPIESDRYLLSCARYIDLNPVHEGLVTRPEQYRRSSYRARIGLDDCSWLDADPCFLALGDTNEARQNRYREFVAERIPEQQLAFMSRSQAMALGTLVAPPVR